METRHKNAILQINRVDNYQKALSKIWIKNGIVLFDEGNFPKPKRNTGNELNEKDLEKINDYFIKHIRHRRESGVFLFCESFIDGMEYIGQNNILGDLISQRFEFVFLDEAQDCSDIQLNILNKLFNHNSKTIFQQIGDENQAISETK